MVPTTPTTVVLLLSSDWPPLALAAARAGIVLLVLGAGVALARRFGASRWERLVVAAAVGGTALVAWSAGGGVGAVLQGAASPVLAYGSGLALGVLAYGATYGAAVLVQRAYQRFLGLRLDVAPRRGVTEWAAVHLLAWVAGVWWFGWRGVVASALLGVALLTGPVAVVVGMYAQALTRLAAVVQLLRDHAQAARALAAAQLDHVQRLGQPSDTTAPPRVPAEAVVAELDQLCDLLARALQSPPRGRPRGRRTGLDHATWQKTADAMLALRQRGVTIAGIAARYGVSEDTAQRWMTERRLELHRSAEPACPRPSANASDSDDRQRRQPVAHRVRDMLRSVRAAVARRNGGRGSAAKQSG
jgi:transposase-like protein